MKRFEVPDQVGLPIYSQEELDNVNPNRRIVLVFGTIDEPAVINRDFRYSIIVGSRVMKENIYLMVGGLNKLVIKSNTIFQSFGNVKIVVSPITQVRGICYDNSFVSGFGVDANVSMFKDFMGLTFNDPEFYEFKFSRIERERREILWDDNKWSERESKGII